MGGRRTVGNAVGDAAERLVAARSERLGGRRATRQLVVTVLAMPVIALALVIAADLLVPDRWMMSNLYEATITHGLDADNYDQGYTAQMIDEFSECLRMTVGLGDPPGRGVIESAILSPTLGSCPGAVSRIQGWAQGEGLLRAYDYARYWNGMSVLFRPLIATVGVTGARVLAALATVGATWFYWSAAQRRLGGRPAGFMVLVMVLTIDFIDLPGSLPHALSWSAAMIAAAIVMLLPHGCSNWAVAWWSLVIGAVYLFVADLNNTDLAWALATSSVALTAVGRHPVGRAARRTLVAAVAWIAGFAWLWMTKWVIYGMVAGFDRVWDDVFGQINTRLDGHVDGSSPTLWDATERVLRAWWDIPLTPIVVPLLAVSAVVLVYRGSPSRLRVIERVLAGAPAAIPFVWYATLRQHTYLHYWFVYRSLAIAAAIVIGALLIERSRQQRTAAPAVVNGPATPEQPLDGHPHDQPDGQPGGQPGDQTPGAAAS